MKHLLSLTGLIVFLTMQSLQAQKNEVFPKKNQIENGKGLKAQDYYSLSDKQYSNLMNLKDKKEITLKDGSLAYIVKMEEIAVAGQFSRAQLAQLRLAFCSVPLAPGAPCEGDCRPCPEGYICESITRPSLSLDLNLIRQNDLPTITEKGESAQGNFALIRPAIKKCIALPSNLRN